MDFWIGFWTVFLLLGLALFVVVAVLVTVGGFADMRALFKSIQSSRDCDED